MQTAIFTARLATRNFEFEACGASAEDARMALKTGLLKHALQYDMPADWWREWEGDIESREVALGACYRDREKLTQM